ncbi:ABC-type efflux pump membrane fusion component YbhG [hydrothermal vent metagenome]|uniref:ABC-type efflux pump membrane fusion component YbhG n=1 Tax=hydrothermal vent metagenome TaxID=652676 RepID=A0A3B1DYT5_9ZZZZ
MKKKIRIIILFFLIAAVAGGIWYWKSHQQTTNEDVLILYGNTDIRQVELAINGSERLGKVLAQEGDIVKKGQLLAELELERFNLAVARAEAQIETQKEVVNRLEAGTRSEEIREAKAALTVAQVNQKDVEANFKRVLTLKEKKAVTQQKVDDILAQRDSAVANVQLKQAALDLAIAGPRKEDIAQAKALLKGLEVELAIAKHNLHDASLHAPSDGIIQERILEVGDMASPQKTIFTMALIDPVWIRIYVSEPDLGKIHEGMKGTVITDSFPDKEYEGWIGFISPTAEFTPKPVETTELRTKLVYQVRLFVKNPQGELRLGMPATVKIKLNQSKVIENQNRE